MCKYDIVCKLNLTKPYGCVITAWPIWYLQYKYYLMFLLLVKLLNISCFLWYYTGDENNELPCRCQLAEPNKQTAVNCASTDCTHYSQSTWAAFFDFHSSHMSTIFKRHLKSVLFWRTFFDLRFELDLSWLLVFMLALIFLPSLLFSTL